MATIQSQLAIVDGMTGPLRNICTALNLTLDSFEAVQVATGQAVDTQAFQNARTELARVNGYLSDIEDQARQTRSASDLGSFQDTRAGLSQVLNQLDQAETQARAAGNSMDLGSFQETRTGLTSLSNQLGSVEQQVRNALSGQDTESFSTARASLSQMNAQLNQVEAQARETGAAMDPAGFQSAREGLARMSTQLDQIEAQAAGGLDFRLSGLDSSRLALAQMGTALDTLAAQQRAIDSNFDLGTFDSTRAALGQVGDQLELVQRQAREAFTSGNIDSFSGARASLAQMRTQLTAVEAQARDTGAELDARAYQDALADLTRMESQLQSAEDQARLLQDRLGGVGDQTTSAGNAADKMKNKFLAAAAAIGAALSVKNILNLSDSMTQVTARLDLVTGDTSATKELEDQIMASANRARAAYQSTADSISKMGIMAKDAFNNTDELVAFTELVNKSFTIAGTSAQGIEAAMLQLTQAMGSGVLRGEELNSIFEQAPTMIQTIADHLGVPIGAIREMASEGQITADIVKNAMLGASAEINAQFESMPYTFGQVWTMIQNGLLEGFQPLIQVIGAGAQFIYDNWSTIEPVLVGIAAAALFLATAWGINTAVTWLQVAANRALLASMLANPYLWVALAIGVLIGYIYKWVQAVGGIQNAWEICKLYMLASWAALSLGWYTGVYWVLDLLDTMKYGWMICGVAISGFMGDTKVAVLSILQAMINGSIDLINKFINTLNKIPGVNISAVDKVTFAATAAAENEAKKQTNADLLKSYENDLNAVKAERQGTLDMLETEALGALNAVDAAVAAGKAEAAASDNTLANFGDMLGGMSTDLGSVAGNTGAGGSIVSALEDTSEDLKFLRDLAEQEAINRFTTAEVKIDMSGMTNKIDSDMDLDGVLGVFTDGFAEAIELAREGAPA